MTASVVPPASVGDLVACVDLLRVAVAAYLTRFKGVSRTHIELDLWLPDLVHRPRPRPACAQRTHSELYVRWMQEIRHFQPSTVARQLSVACGFYAPAS